jgi:hypothetical protein
MLLVHVTFCAVLSCAALRPVQVRKASFIRHWQLLGVHGQPRQLQFFEVRQRTALQ